MDSFLYLSAMKKILSLALIATFYVQNLSSQTVKLDVIFKGDKIGTTTVTRTVGANGQVTIELKGESNASVLFVKRNIKTHYTSVYENGSLVKTNSTYEVNGDLDSYVKAVWDGSKYTVETERGKSTQSAKVVYSVLSLFFSEPVGKTEIWSERIGGMVPLKNLGSNRYVFKNAIKGGSDNIYKYKDGKLYEVEMSTPVGASYMRPTK